MATYQKGGTGDVWKFRGQIYINEETATIGGLKIHSHLMDASQGYANEFKGEFLATTGTTDGIAAHYHMAASGKSVMRSILGVAYLDTGKTLSGTDAAQSWISGVLGSVAIEGVVNGTAVTVTGTYGGLGNMVGATLTEVANMSAVWADSQATQVPTTGDAQLLLLTVSGSATLDQAIKVTGAAKLTNFLKIDVADGCVTSTALSGGTSQYLKVVVDSVAYTILMTRDS
jgi:hypothetical protein